MTVGGIRRGARARTGRADGERGVEAGRRARIAFSPEPPTARSAPPPRLEVLVGEELGLGRRVQSGPILSLSMDMKI